MSVENIIQAHQEGVKGEYYHPIELPSDEGERARIINSLKGRIILFQDEHNEDYYKKGLLKDSDNEVYCVEWLNGKGERVNNRYHIHDLTGLMVQTI